MLRLYNLPVHPYATSWVTRLKDAHLEFRQLRATSTVYAAGEMNPPSCSLSASFFARGHRFSNWASSGRSQRARASPELAAILVPGGVPKTGAWPALWLLVSLVSTHGQPVPCLFFLFLPCPAPPIPCLLASGGNGLPQSRDPCRSFTLLPPTVVAVSLGPIHHQLCSQVLS